MTEIFDKVAAAAAAAVAYTLAKKTNLEAVGLGLTESERETRKRSSRMSATVLSLLLLAELHDHQILGSSQGDTFSGELGLVRAGQDPTQGCYCQAKVRDPSQA